MTRMTTEARNSASENIDTLSSLEIVRLMNEEDARVAVAVGQQAAPIAKAIEVIARAQRAAQVELTAAIQALASMGKRADNLIQLGRFVVERRS